MKKRCISLVLMFFGILGAAQETEVLSRLTLQNDLSLSRNEELVEIPESHVEELRDEVFKIVDAEAGQELVYQWLNNGDLLVQADFKPREQKTITFLAASPQDFPPQVYGRFVPERYGDFTWENENIAFRMYGSPLEKVPSQNAWGLDVWAKRTPKMIINQWYKNGHYHTDHGTGLDFFKVGKSLGAGDIIPLSEGKMQYTGNYTSYKILESGPLRFSFELYYPAAKIAGQSVVTIKKISLDADAQLNKIQVRYRFSKGKRLPVFAGLVHWNQQGDKTMDEQFHYVSYWPKATNNGVVGTAILFPEKAKLIDFRQHLGTELKLKSGEVFTFYVGAAWDKAGKITDAQAWNQYVKNYAQRIAHPIQIKSN